ncbi:unnamed protein product [Durusdinium trenchii]|uniref:Uncharacterized protein n=1 Tax=Durusdinium trenchii TaxID=1381693 RepID=A0ABP0PCX8_9DINO
MDIICLLKRNASDSDLCQGSVLLWPYRYTAQLGAMPMEPRPLEPVKAAKKTEYLKLAEALLERAPRESSARSVQFLLNICSEDLKAEDPPRLPWIETDCGPPSEIGFSRIAGRIAPAMKFYAKHL